MRISHRNRGGVLAGLRRQQRRLTRAVLTLCTMVWVNMALQPCLMALEQPDAGGADAQHDCPHCPPAERHCGDEAPPPRCTFVDDIDYDGRTLPRLDLDFHQSFAVLAAPATALIRGDPARAHRAPGAEPEPPPPDFTLRYCVLLN